MKYRRWVRITYVSLVADENLTTIVYVDTFQVRETRAGTNAYTGNCLAIACQRVDSDYRLNRACVRY
jgi:hypothetical protein